MGSRRDLAAQQNAAGGCESSMNRLIKIIMVLAGYAAALVVACIFAQLFAAHM